ncbi:DUF3944 domain-containing protein [Flammeovirga pacifica]|nr:DUF3944 domain-containing protein [Flammeovirga pacifica]
MRTDSSLWFLDSCDNDQLETLFNILTREKSGEYRLRERLSNCLEAQIYGDDYFKYSDRIALELQYQANEGVGDFLRMNQKDYRDILIDAIIQLNIPIMGIETVEQLEEELILTLNDRVIGIENAGIYSMPFDLLINEAFNEEIERSIVNRAIIPAIIFISLLRLSRSNNLDDLNKVIAKK